MSGHIEITIEDIRSWSEKDQSDERKCITIKFEFKLPERVYI
jgi:hypothetical protein